MNSKTSYTLSSSSSNTIREKLSSAIFDSDIVKRLYLAQQKLRPIIDDLLSTATEKSVNRPNYLTVEQYEDAVLASQILNEVEKILSTKQNGKCTKKTYNFNDIKLERENVKVNKLGKICVDTSILIQLIELHKSLGDILNNAQEICTDFSNRTSSYTETNNSGANQQYDSCTGRDSPLDETFNVTVAHKNSENIKPKIKINILNKNNHLTEQQITTKGNTKFEKVITKILSSDSYPLQENIVVMYSEDELDNTKKLSTLSEERTSNSEANLVDDRQSSRKIKSTGSIKCDNQDAKVTDVAGARKIILNCLYDLKKVRSFLERIDVDVSADVHIQSAMIDNTKAEESGPSSRAQEKNNHKGNTNNRVTISDEPGSVNNKNKKVDENNEYKGECSCGSIYVSESPMELLLDAGDENASKLIICIKGKTEEDGDVQIIIRQCSECKNVGGKELTDDHSDKEQNDFPSASSAYDEEKHTSQGEEDAKHESSDINLLIDPNDNSIFEPPPPEHMSDEKKESVDYQHMPLATSSEDFEQDKPKLNILFDPNHPSQTVVEPTVNIPADEHSLELEKLIDVPEDIPLEVPTDISQDISEHISQDELQDIPEDISADIPQDIDKSNDIFDKEKSGINVIFDPDDPSKSIVEPPKNVSSEKDPLEKKDLTFVKEPERIPLDNKYSKKSNEKEDDCSKIKLYETTNLCFSTDDGQELVISLTIRPKTGGPVPKISLNDIFSDSTTEAEKTHTNQTQKHIDNIFSSEPEITVELHDRQEFDYFIPLSRTKICSSLEFDVSVMESKIYSKGIKHVNQGIVVRLKEMGVNNLLRACRPVKCGRPAVLNEKLRKSRPYSASLTSLPLEDTDTHIIDQSLDMSFNKTKYSSAKTKNKRMIHFTQLKNITDNIHVIKNMQISYVYVQRSVTFTSKNQIKLKNDSIRKKLGYYINLVHDVETDYPKRFYEVNFFEIKKLHLSTSADVNSTNTNEQESIEIKYKSLPISITKKDSHHSMILKREPEIKVYHSKQTSVTRKNNIERAVSNSSQLKHKINEENLKLRRHDSSKENKKFISKIPVYKSNRKTGLISKDKLDCESYIYAISLQSLPKDDADGIKDFGVIHANGENTKSTIEVSKRKKQNKLCNKDWDITERIINNDSEIYSSNKTSHDSLELYFNNFFRDKYFSKLALCQKQSSNQSLKPRKKKSEYHYSRSHSQTCFCDSKLDEKLFKNNFISEKQSRENMYFWENKTFSENYFKDQDNLNTSISVIYYFSKMFCKYWVKDKYLSEQDNVNKKVSSVKSLASFGNLLKNEEFQKFVRSIKKRILEGWYVFYFYFLFTIMYNLTEM